MIDDEHDARLQDCLTTVQQLEEENRQLRRAAATFGQLAERLNEELGRERRLADRDRRRESRDTIDRRGSVQPR
jgi:predicted RNase H-like nuclease (RuvC/YqgF family)